LGEKKWIQHLERGEKKRVSIPEMTLGRRIRGHSKKRRSSWVRGREKTSQAFPKNERKNAETGKKSEKGNSKVPTFKREENSPAIEGGTPDPLDKRVSGEARKKKGPLQK